jgi:hypothetical protein
LTLYRAPRTLFILVPSRARCKTHLAASPEIDASGPGSRRRSLTRELTDSIIVEERMARTILAARL